MSNFKTFLFEGLPPGTVVITDKAVDSFFRPQFDQVVLGKVIVRSTELDQDLAKELLGYSREMSDLPTVIGNTMCTYDFYEGIYFFKNCLLLALWKHAPRGLMTDRCFVSSPLLRSGPAGRSSVLILHWGKIGVPEEGLRCWCQEHWDGVNCVCCHVSRMQPQRYFGLSLSSSMTLCEIFSRLTPY